MADYKLRKNPDTGEVFMWEPGMTEWRPVQARKNGKTGEVFVWGDGDKDWRNLGSYPGVQVRPESRPKQMVDAEIARKSAAPEAIAAPDMDLRAPRIDLSALAQVMTLDQAPRLIGSPSSPDAPPVIDTARPPSVAETGARDPIAQLLAGNNPSLQLREAMGEGVVPFKPGVPPQVPVRQPTPKAAPVQNYVRPTAPADSGAVPLRQRVAAGEGVMPFVPGEDPLANYSPPLDYGPPTRGGARRPNPFDQFDEPRNREADVSGSMLIQPRRTPSTGIGEPGPPPEPDLGEPYQPGAWMIPEWTPTSEIGKGLKTGVKGAAQMAVAIGTIPVAAADKTNIELLDLYERADDLPRELTPPQLAQALGIDLTDSHQRIMLTLAQQYHQADDAERDAAMHDAGMALSSNRELLAGMVETIKAYSAEMEKTQGRVPNFTDIGDVKDFADWFMFNSGQALPYLAVTALAGAAAGPAGVGASGYAMGVGDIQAGLVEQGITDGGEAALLGAVPYAALEYLGPAARYFRPSKKVLGEVATSYFKRLGREVPANAVEEFINEAGQEIIKDYAMAAGGGEPVVVDDQKLLAWLNSGMAGVAGGAPMGAVTAIPGEGGGEAPAAVKPPPRKPGEPAKADEPPQAEQAPEAAPEAQPVVEPSADDELLAAMGTEPETPAQNVRNAQNVQPEPDRSQTGAEKLPPNVEIIDEVDTDPETGESVPTGRKIRWDKANNTFTPVEDGATAAPSEADAVPPQTPEGDTAAGAVDPLLEALGAKPEPKPAPKVKPRNYKAEGASAFANGATRQPPADLVAGTEASGDPKAYNKAAKAWLQGWDRANLAAPVDENPPQNIPENIPAPAPEAKKPGWTKVGTNRKGFPVYEDENGVRSYVENGVRITQPVGVVPGGGITVGKPEREFQLAEEAKRDEPGSVSDFPPISDFEAGNPGPKLRAWVAGASDQQLIDALKRGSGLADNAIRAETQRRQIGDYAPRVPEAAPAETTPAGKAESPTEPAPSGPTPPARAPDYGSKNTFVTTDRAEAIRAKLRDKLRSQLNSGFDPETLALGIELAAFHIEAGARKFADFAREVAADLGTTPDKLRAHLRGWYSGARATMENQWLHDIVMPLMPALRRELDRLNLKRVGLYIDDNAARAKDGVQGMFNAYWNGRMDILIGQSLDPLATLHHEAIHALRHMNLFTPAEWRALEIKAARSWVEKYDIAKRYPDALPSEQIEEAIAEAFADWAKGQYQPVGHLATAFEKIRRFFAAIRNVMKGAGFQSAEDVFGKTFSGEVGGRPPMSIEDRIAAIAASKRQAAPAQNQNQQQQANAATQMMGSSAHIPSRGIWDELWRNNTGVWNRIRGGAAAAHDHVDTARIFLQDRFLPVLRAQEAVIRETGRAIPEDQNAYRAEETFSGKVGRHLFEIDEDYTKPIIDLMVGESGQERLDDGYVGKWLYARHAVERNERIAAINPNKPDGGSGMMTDEARQILAEARSGPNFERLKEIGKLIDNLRERTLALRVDAGLMTEDEAQVWRDQYKAYVPLKGFADTENSDAMLDIGGVGRRFNVRGAESRMALGRGSEAFSPLQAAITQAQEVAIRAEKNRVGNALYNLAKENEAPALWKVKTPKVKQYFNRSTGLVETRVEDPRSLILEPNEMAVKVDGKEKRIVFKDVRLAEAAGAVGADRMNWFISVMSKAARIFSAVNTMLDPEFVVRNAIRDMQAAQINIRNFGEGDRNAIAKAMLKNWPKAFLGVYRGQANKADTDWTRYYREFEQAGAKVSFWKLDQPTAARDDFRKRVRMATPGTLSHASRWVRFSTRDNPVLGFIERTNLAVDNAVRLAAFVAARQAGWSASEAASLSKNLTVNFNRRGEWGATINALYPFANAGLQGTQVMFRAFTSKRMAKYAVGMIGMGLILDLVNAWMSHEDDDGELAYDKIPDWKNRTNLAVMLGPDAENAASIWMPYGYSLFPYLGQQAGKIIRGVKKPEDALKDFAAAAMGAFSPIGGFNFEGNAVRDLQEMVTPTMLDPINEMAMNEDWLGRPIRPENPWQDYGPAAYKYYGGVSDISKAISDAANRATGGDIARSGAVDISPEYLDHAFSFVFGGAGRFAGRIGDTFGKLVTGRADEIEDNDIPFYRSVKTETGEWLDRDRFYRFKNEVKAAREAAKTYSQTGHTVPADVRQLTALYGALSAAEKALKASSARKKKVIANRSLTFSQRQNAIRAIEQANSSVYLRFNKAFLKRMGPQGE